MNKKIITARRANWRDISEAECLEAIGFTKDDLYESGLEWAQSFVFANHYFRRWLEKNTLTDHDDGLPVLTKSIENYINDFIVEYDLNADVFDNLQDNFFSMYFKYPKFKVPANICIKPDDFSGCCYNLQNNFSIEFGKFMKAPAFIITNFEYCSL